MLFIMIILLISSIRSASGYITYNGFHHYQEIDILLYDNIYCLAVYHVKEKISLELLL